MIKDIEIPDLKWKNFTNLHTSISSYIPEIGRTFEIQYSTGISNKEFKFFVYTSNNKGLLKSLTPNGAVDLETARELCNEEYIRIIEIYLVRLASIGLENVEAKR